MSVLLLPPIFQFFDNNGDPLANGFVDTFAAGTTTRQATFTDSTGTVAAPNPIELNAAGRPTSGSGAIWGEGAYKFIVRNSDGVQIGDPLDSVISFAGLAAAASSYAETFSGNGVQTVFTTSTDLGTDPKALLVSVANRLQEIAQNGQFTTDTLWTKGAGWTIGAGVATATGAISTALSQVPVVDIVVGQAYAVTYTITRSAGGLIPSIGGQNGVERTASGTYREIIIAAATTPIAFTGNAFTGTLDNVSITEAVSENMALLASNAYTINGTTLTFAAAPPSGVNNIDVRAPSLLLGAATTAANLAQLYAANALTSETAAAASASLAGANVKTKPAVACATTANITLSGEQTIDGVLTSASRVLVKDQTNATQNGVYVSAAGAWARAVDADTWVEIQGQSVFTLGGSTNINKTWANTNELGGTIGSDNITWTQFFTAPIPYTAATTSAAAYFDLAEGTTNGTNRMRITTDAALSFDATYTIPGLGGTAVTTDAPQVLSNKRLIATAGTTATAPIILASGTNLTTAAAGSAEYDGKVLYYTPISTQRGIIPSMQEYAQNATVVGANGTSAQNIFGFTNGFTLSGGTFYEFEGEASFSKTAGATSHNFSLLFGGTATLNNIRYSSMASVNNTSLATLAACSQITIAAATATAIIPPPANANVFITARVKGIVSVNTGGTFNPQYQLDAAPGGAYTVAIGSYFKIWPIGASGANVSVGAIS